MENLNNILTVSHSECCGCRICEDACPKHCISFQKRENGFFFPSVNETECINCAICIKKCPVLNESSHKIADDCYAAKSYDENNVSTSSSGGIFGTIAEYVFENGGVVYGASFDDNLKLRHTSACDTRELLSLKKSKYIQSNCSGIYNKVKEDLVKNRITVFCGTPCQCNALLNYVPDKLRKNLILIDFVCHGVPSQDFFDKCISWYEDKHKCKVLEFSFRHKDNRTETAQKYKMKILKNGNTSYEFGRYYQNPFYFGFQKRISLRECCYQCKWANPRRCSDITLGDFWGIEKYLPYLNSKEGISLILPNTLKGRALIEKLIGLKKIWFNRLPAQNAFESNECLLKATTMPASRTAFFHDLQEKTFDEVVSIYLVPKMMFFMNLYYSLPSFLRKLILKTSNLLRKI